ncbi:MAG TPA: hypothetical protein DHN29_24555 [Cytophagales bacterium]|nr:hypothetical protein [Cytophagales bacterium]|tara:strand:- start:63 stop:359 length:297 start_codon:yes stop_codon:yes gene_type:complete
MDFINVRKTSQSNTIKRSDVKMGEVFVAAGDGRQNVYAHTGVRTVPPSTKPVRFQGINLATGEPASTENGDRNVIVVGTWTLDVDIHEDYKDIAKLIS